MAGTLAAVAEALAAARERWWVIGSTAVALHGAAVTPADVDVLLSEADAACLLPALGLVPGPGQVDARFRSALFARWTDPPLPVEFMAGLHVAGPEAWSAVLPVTREPVAVGSATVFVPERGELAAILRRFGRSKDYGRAALLA